jgi:hypothetical protein
VATHRGRKPRDGAGVSVVAASQVHPHDRATGSGVAWQPRAGGLSRPATGSGGRLAKSRSTDPGPPPRSPA